MGCYLGLGGNLLVRGEHVSAADDRNDVDLNIAAAQHPRAQVSVWQKRHEDNPLKNQVKTLKMAML